MATPFSFAQAPMSTTATLPPALAYRWRHGALQPLEFVQQLPPDQLLAVDRQKQALLRNTERFVRGQATLSAAWALGLLAGPAIGGVLIAVVGPAFGLIEEIAGTVKYVNPPASVAVPPGVVTETDFGPAVPAGVVAVIVVEFTTATEVAEAVPTLTEVAPVRFVPVIVMEVPPVDGP